MSQDIDPDDDALDSYDDDPTTFQHEGRGEEIDPAVSAEEWTDRRHDQISEAGALDDPVDALEVAALSSLAEGDVYGDSTELADRAAPMAPEEAAFVGRTGVAPDEDDLTVGLPPGTDIDDLEQLALDDLIEAELIAIDEGDPETAAIIADEVARRRKLS